ncbi:unnamed protein product [Pleuronectes platessa]|uniref:Uncharacterized protein n=1 Tax=Pleuronectes platessa TaxID=8262 RepID=A0A9N7VCV4_PLEPL|nr:unnamed protein product [Pleuronectes platessa]
MSLQQLPSEAKPAATPATFYSREEEEEEEEFSVGFVFTHHVSLLRTRVQKRAHLPGKKKKMDCPETLVCASCVCRGRIRESDSRAKFLFFLLGTNKWTSCGGETRQDRDTRS